MSNQFISLFSGVGGSAFGARAAGYELAGAVEFDKKIADLYYENHQSMVLSQDVKDVDPTLFNVDRSKTLTVQLSPPCFPAGVTVLTNEGLKSIENVMVGDSVLTHKGRYRKVTNIMKRTSDIIELKGLGHWGLQCTPDHPFLVCESKREFKCEKGVKSSKRFLQDPEWMSAEDCLGKHWLSLCHYPELPIPSIEYSRAESTRGQAFDLESNYFWWIVGFWVGNGWCRYSDGSDNKRNRGVVYLCDGHSEAHHIESVLDKSGTKFRRSIERTSIRFEINSRPLCRWLIENFGHHAENKTIPSWLLGASIEKRKAFFDGYIRADGSAYTNSSQTRSVSASTVSRKLAISLRLLGLSLGFTVTLYNHIPTRICTIEGRVVNEKPSFKINFADSDRSDLHSKIIESDVSYRSGLIKKIKLANLSTVYDITVDEDESFIADGIIVHNCQEYSAANCNPDITSDRALALDNCYHILEYLDPDRIIIENVRAYQRSEPMDRFREWLQIKGYEYIEQIVNCADIGVPQSRIRYFLMAVRRGETVRHLPSTHSAKLSGQLNLFGDNLNPWVGWYEAIVDLIPDMQTTKLSNNQQLALRDWKLKHPTLIESRKRKRSEFDELTIRKDRTPSPTITSRMRDQVPKLLIPTIGYRSDLPPIYSEYRLAPTVKAMMMSNGESERKGCWRLIDNCEVREMSVRGLARLQTFPDDTILPKNKGLACKVIGNAVPPLVMQKILQECF